MNTQTKILILALTFASILANAQRTLEQDVISQNKVKVRLGYSISLDDNRDSTLITEEHFNIRGRETLHKNFKSNRPTSEYEYIYVNDSIRISRITKLNDTIHSITKLSYDKKNRHIKSVDYDEYGAPSGTYETIKYKKKGRVVEHRYYAHNKLMHQIRMTYDKHKSLIRYCTKRKGKGKWKEVPIKNGGIRNIQVENFDNFNNSGLKMKKTTHNVQSSNLTIGSVGPVKIEKGDVLITEKYIDENGLVQYENQFLNAELIGKKEFKYVQYK